MIWWIYLMSHICMQIVPNQSLAIEAINALSKEGSVPKEFQNKGNQSALRLYADWGYTMDSKKPLKQQCRSTGYQNEFSWVAVKNRNRVIEEPRRFLKDLRSDMYKNADAEKCHQPEMRNVQEFLECQVRRHMRLELHIPKYPNVPT
ncbi:uncharacterized protein LOC122613239 [Drosophila teissieri]|uniref:uncharacterized protein LOC122613239 n=1 Tax=Drosophila teissieri TaxID=7243 RepID=UPI001CBA28C9|nr:uncharacterized protein LOC122613239 [Drosophila teissieri]